jgi:hypothetical protein
MALLRQGWIGLIGDVVAFGPPLWRYVVKPILGLLSLGGDIDFSIEHWGKPGWVGDMLVPFGHPIFQFILIAIGLSLIYFDTRRRAGTNVSYPAIGMTLSAVVFAGFFIAWIWPSPATKTQNKSLAWVFSGMAGKSDANGFRVSDVQFLAAKNETGKAVRLVDAYIQSSIDGGKKRPLLLNTYEHGLVPLSQANPIPPNTENITLMAEFPELSESEFMKDWGNISFVIQDSDQAFQGKVDEQTFRGVFDGYRPKAPPPRATASA